MPNAIEMLREDHQKVQDLFQQFERSRENDEKEQIVKNAVSELEVHAALEEEIFYPAAQRQIDEKELIDEAREEHHVVKLLIGELKKMSAQGERYDAKFKVLAESVKHHIKEEESELFPMLEDNLDTEGLGAEMEKRKQELQQASQKRSRTKNSQSKRRSHRTQKGRRTAGKKARKKATSGR